MKYQRMARMAKQAIDKRGGIDALKQDLQEATEAAKGKGSLKEKAKAAAEALKQFRIGQVLYGFRAHLLAQIVEDAFQRGGRYGTTLIGRRFTPYSAPTTMVGRNNSAYSLALSR